MRRIGVDVGGTFTDLIYIDDEAAKVIVHKTPSTPADPSIGTVQGISELCAMAGIEPSQLDQVFHGTTVATNIVIEHNGAKVGMITTKGYRDILHIARHKKPMNFSLWQNLPWQAFPIVRRRFRLTVNERIDKDGNVLIPLDDDEVRAQVRQAQGGAGRGGLRVPAVLVPEPRARAARRRDRARGVPRGVPLGLERGHPAVPRVRALLDGRPQRLRRPQGLELHRPLRRRAARDERQVRHPPDDLGRRRRDARGRHGEARQPAHVGADRRRRRRHLDGPGSRARTTSSRSTSAARRPTSASRRTASCA